MEQESNVIREMGILAQKAYSSYSIGNNLKGDGLSSSYTVIATQDTLIGDLFPNFFGFQAMLLKDSSNNYVIGFRGTEIDGPIWNAISDLATDASMAVGNFTEQMQMALAFVKKALETYGSDGLSTNNLTFTGHSLGGSLAEVAGYTFGSDTYAYNPFGVKTSLVTSPIIYNGTLAILGITSDRTTDNITNIVNVGGNFSDPITGVGSYLLNSYVGEINYVKDRDGGNTLGLAPHSMSDLNESIDVYNTLLEIFPAQDYNSLTEILDPIFPIDKQIPRFLDSLGEIVGATKTGDLKTFVTNIMNAGYQNLVLEGLADPFPVNLSELAKSNQAYLYALLNLNPYTITGVNYENVNQDGFLDSSKYSDKFLVDRQAFLFQLTYPATPSTTGDDTQFRDNRLGLEAYAGNGSPDISERQYLFGNLEGELLAGGEKEDHLYGMDGDDTLIGNGGDDYLEGGKGQDTLTGGSGADTFFILGEHTAYDTFNGGEGTDTIQGSAGDDIIRVHDFQGANTVEAIDGGGGADIIAGTDLADTIDLSATTVTGIARIEGGAGADTIKGTSGNDVLYGGSQDNPEDEARDLLAGGAGADEYHVGIGDIIEDPDNQGTIWFDGEQLSSLVFKQQSEDGDYYETADNTWRGVINDDGSLNIFHGEDAAIFTIKNFATGNFGITLADYVPPETTFTFSGESETSTAGVYGRSVGPNPGDTQWYYRFRRELADGATATEQPEFTLDNIPSVNVTGSEDFDFLYGTTQSDILNGGGGDDIINGWDKRYEEFLPATPDMGGDILSGGAGNDYIIGSMGSDAIDGGDDDILSGKDGIDYIYGGQGKDVLLGGGADDYFRRQAA